MEEKNKYINDYIKNTYQRVNFKIRKDDTEVLEKLASVENKNAYILELIRKDIKKSKRGK